MYNAERYQFRSKRDTELQVVRVVETYLCLCLCLSLRAGMSLCHSQLAARVVIYHEPGIQGHFCHVIGGQYPGVDEGGTNFPNFNGPERPLSWRNTSGSCKFSPASGGSDSSFPS